MSRRRTRPFWLGEDERTWDHVRIHLQLYKDPRLGAYHLALYGGIACHAETATGEADPANKTLATYLKCDEKTVRRYAGDLKEWRYIDIIERPGETSIYRLLPPPPLGADSGTAVTGPAVESKNDPETADSGTAVGGTAVPLPGEVGTSARAPRTQDPRTPDSRPDEQEEKLELEKPSSDPMDRPDVRRLVDLFVTLVSKNLGREARPGRRWADACRLLIDNDNQPLDEIERVMRWATTDEFWRTNILSFTKFREKFSTLQLQSKRNGTATNIYKNRDRQYEGAIR